MQVAYLYLLSEQLRQQERPLDARHVHQALLLQEGQGSSHLRHCEALRQGCHYVTLCQACTAVEAKVLQVSIQSAAAIARPELQ